MAPLSEKGRNMSCRIQKPESIVTRRKLGTPSDTLQKHAGRKIRFAEDGHRLGVGRDERRPEFARERGRRTLIFGAGGKYLWSQQGGVRG